MDKQVADRFRLLSDHWRERFSAECTELGLTAHQTDLIENHVCGKRAGQPDAEAKLMGHFLKWPKQAEAAQIMFTKYTTNTK